MSHARLGDRVRIQYTRLRRRNAILFRARSPHVLEFTVGSEEIVSSISNGVLGMALGERKRLKLLPTETYEDTLLVHGDRPLLDKRVRLEVRLLTIDSSSDANRSKKQYDIGGES